MREGRESGGGEGIKGGRESKGGEGIRTRGVIG